MYIKTPATTANMGPGFDSVGMALELYNEIWVEEIDYCDLEIKSSDERVPITKQNIIYQAIKYFYTETGILNSLPKIKITQKDAIPMTRGLGSSAACIVSGLLAANELSGLHLSNDDIAFMAATIEGHPDNTAPALLGGIITGVLTKTKLEYIKIDNKDLINKLNFAVMIPDFLLSTEKARKVLPKAYTIQDTIYNSSRVGLLIASFLTGDFKKLTTALNDKIHQPYRSNIIPGMDKIFAHSLNSGALGVFLSGAGPTIIAVTQEDDFCNIMEPLLKTLSHKWDIKFLKPDFEGAKMIQ